MRLMMKRRWMSPRRVIPLHVISRCGCCCCRSRSSTVRSFKILQTKFRSPSTKRLRKCRWWSEELGSFFFFFLTWLRSLRRSSGSRPRTAAPSSKWSEITVSSTAIDDRSRILTSFLRRFRVFECNLKNPKP